MKLEDKSCGFRWIFLLEERLDNERIPHVYNRAAEQLVTAMERTLAEVKADVEVEGRRGLST